MTNATKRVRVFKVNVIVYWKAGLCLGNRSKVKKLYLF